MAPPMANRRLMHLAHTLASPPLILGTLKLGSVSYDVPTSSHSSRLVRSREQVLLDVSDPVNMENLEFMLKKYLLGQDVFLVGQPGPYARRLGMTFARLINAEYEYVALHRDVGETELKQGREIREGGTLAYVDSPAVRAIKHGRLLILEGIEKAERGIMPVLNNLLENREMNLDDGTHIIHPLRYQQLQSQLQHNPTAAYDTTIEQGKLFVPAHKNFRVIAIAAPVPPYPGYPLDPPFRSRFQARFVDPVGAMLALKGPREGIISAAAARAGAGAGANANASASTNSGVTGDTKVGGATATTPPPTPSHTFFEKLRNLILTTQYASERRNALEAISRTALPPFPQTALAKLRALVQAFPLPPPLPPPPASDRTHSWLAQPSNDAPPSDLTQPSDPSTPPSDVTPHGLTPSQLARLVLTLHPALAHAPLQAWAILGRYIEDAGLGELGSPHGACGGLLGYQLQEIRRTGEATAEASFARRGCGVVVEVPVGPRALRAFPFVSKPGGENGDGYRGDARAVEFTASPRFMGLLTCFVQAHALGWHISFIPPVLPSTASTSSTTLIKVFSEILGYEVEPVHVYRELGGRELIMRRRIEEGGATKWEPSPLIESAWSGRLLHLEGLDVIGSTAGSLARLLQDGESELWEGKRLVGSAYPTHPHSPTNPDIDSGLSTAHPSFRVITTPSKSLPLKDWLSDEHANMFFPVPSEPMGAPEERDVLRKTGCPGGVLERLLRFAGRYRASLGGDGVVKNRRLGTRTLVGIARRVAVTVGDGEGGGVGGVDLEALVSQALLAEFLPAVEKLNLGMLLEEAGIFRKTPGYNPPPFVKDGNLVFPRATEATDAGATSPKDTLIPLFEAKEDPGGAAAHIPHTGHFYDNSLQTGLMRDLAIDLEVLKAHVVLLGNQGVGKNKIVDRLCELLNRPREYIQLHRDTTVTQLMFTTSLVGGMLRYTDSPLLRAIKHGRFIIIDEADKAPEHVVAIFRSLGGQGEMSLADGRRVRRVWEREGDVVVHRNFRLILLANRPGYPFLGNHFLQVLGESFSAHAVSNPDQDSERKLISQLAPELSEELVRKLVEAFNDLRKEHESGVLNYPYSLRELINLVRHLKAYPNDSLADALRNIFDFDIYKPETIDKLSHILIHHGLDVPHLGLEAAREATKKTVPDVEFTPKDDSLTEPKEGKHDDKEHHGGNTWAGGTGGRDTAGLGGVGGYKRLWKGGEIKQVPQAMKDRVPHEVKEKAREMARMELQRRLEELDMSAAEAKGYAALLGATQAHMASLLDLLEHLAAKEEERVWVKRQTDGELDDTRLTEGLTGESTVYKRRGMEKPEQGRPQLKPKRIRFIFDLSASMYRFQYDGRLQRSVETAVMLMETFNRLSRKDKYVWDITGHSGDGPDITLVPVDKPPIGVKDRWKIAEKMNMIPQYAFAGDFTVEAISLGVTEVAKYDADDWFVIAVTDANFGRYTITPEELVQAMNRTKVNTALICIGEGAEATWIPQRLPGKGFRVANTGDIPTVLRSILSTMVARK